MKKFAKKSVLAAAAFGLCASVFGLSWGGIVDNNSKVTTSDFFKINFSQSNAAFLWVKTPFAGNSLNFSAEGMYKYRLNVTSGNTKLTNILDIDLLMLSGKTEAGKGTLNYSAGRFFVADSTSVVMAQNCDGALIRYDGSGYSVNAYAGYTGLLNILNVSILTEKGTAKGTTKEFYDLCDPYLPLSLGANFKLGGRHNLGAQVNAFMDLKDSYNRFYLNFTANGPVSDILGYNAAVIAGSEKFENVMLYAKAGLNYFGVKNALIGGSVEIASGEYFGLKPFRTFSSRTAYNGNGNTELSGLIIPQIYARYTINQLLISGSEKIVISAPDTTMKVQGFDTSLSFIYNIFSDLQAGLDVNAFIDTEKKQNNNFEFTLKASLAF